MTLRLSSIVLNDSLITICVQKHKYPTQKDRGVRWAQKYTLVYYLLAGLAGYSLKGTCQPDGWRRRPSTFTEENFSYIEIDDWQRQPLYNNSNPWNNPNYDWRRQPSIFNK